MDSAPGNVPRPRRDPSSAGAIYPAGAGRFHRILDASAGHMTVKGPTAMDADSTGTTAPVIDPPDSSATTSYVPGGRSVGTAKRTRSVPERPGARLTRAGTFAPSVCP